MHCFTITPSSSLNVSMQKFMGIVLFLPSSAPVLFFPPFFHCLISNSTLCSWISLQIDERMKDALQGDCTRYAPGVEIISVRVTKPTIPESIRQNYVQMEEERTKVFCERIYPRYSCRMDPFVALRKQRFFWWSMDIWLYLIFASQLGSKL